MIIYFLVGKSRMYEHVYVCNMYVINHRIIYCPAAVTFLNIISF